MKLESEKIVRPSTPICRVLPALVAMHFEFWEMIPPARSFKADALDNRAATVERKLICLVHENEL